MDTKMDTKELAELLLASIYYETETMGHTNFIFSLYDVAAKLGAVEMDNLKDAAFYLESNGFALLSPDMMGGFSIIITDNGCIYIEQEGETGIVKEYREYLARMGWLPASSTQPGIGAGPVTAQNSPSQEDMLMQSMSKNTSKDIVLQIMHILITDDSLDSKTREDLLRDVDTLRIQFSKNTKNIHLIETLVGTLAGISSIAPLINRLSADIKKTKTKQVKVELP